MVRRAALDEAEAAWRRTLEGSPALHRLRSAAPPIAWRHAILRRPASDAGSRLLIAIMGGGSRISPRVRAYRYGWRSLHGCSVDEEQRRKRTWLPGASSGGGGCDWCGRTAVECGLAQGLVADWEHVESGDCGRFRDVARAWHAAALGTLAAAGWGRLTAGGTTFLQRLGFNLPQRAASAPGAGPRPSVADVRSRLIDDFAATFGAWVEDGSNRAELDAKPPARVAEGQT